MRRFKDFPLFVLISANYREAFIVLMYSASAASPVNICHPAYNLVYRSFDMQ